MIIYIHGFGSSGFGGKAKLLKEHFKQDILLPSLSYVPSLAIHTLEQLIELFLHKGEKVQLIGSSLGGYYAIYLANKYNLKAALINPAMTPYKTLDKIGMATNYFDLSSFEVTQEHMQALKFLEVKECEHQEDYLLLLQTGDELLNYKDAVKKLPHAKAIIEEGGDHSFVNIDDYFTELEAFFELKK